MFTKKPDLMCCRCKSIIPGDSVSCPKCGIFFTKINGEYVNVYENAKKKMARDYLKSFFKVSFYMYIAFPVIGALIILFLSKLCSILF